MWIGSCYDAEQSVDPKKCQSNEVCGYLFMFEELLKQGSRKENMIAKMAGGAQMFVNQNAHNMLNIGQQNIQAVHELLAEWKIPLVAEDVGNNYGRTIEFDPATGELMIRTIGVGDTVI